MAQVGHRCVKSVLFLMSNQMTGRQHQISIIKKHGEIGEDQNQETWKLSLESKDE